MRSSIHSVSSLQRMSHSSFSNAGFRKSSMSHAPFVHGGSPVVIMYPAQAPRGRPTSARQKAVCSPPLFSCRRLLVWHMGRVHRLDGIIHLSDGGTRFDGPLHATEYAAQVPPGRHQLLGC